MWVRSYKATKTEYINYLKCGYVAVSQLKLNIVII